MKTLWVATLNACSLKNYIHKLSWKQSLVLIGMSIIVSCTSSDDVETIITETETTTENQYLIMYTDIDPDVPTGGLQEFYDLDLNNDQIIDFTLNWGSYDWAGEVFNYLALVSNMTFETGIKSISESDYSSPKLIPLDHGSKIFRIEPFNNPVGADYYGGGAFTIGDCLYTPNCFYDWQNKGDKYIGLRFRINGKLHYGWARMNIVSISEWVIKDYAYNAIPNMPINAGQIE